MKNFFICAGFAAFLLFTFIGCADKDKHSKESTSVLIHNKAPNAEKIVISYNNDIAAIGIFSNSNSCELFAPGSNPAGQDLDNPWKGSGKYSIALFTAAQDTAGTYNGLYEFTGKETEEFNFDTDFNMSCCVEFQGNYLTIRNIPSNLFTAAVLDDQQNHIAVAMRSGIAGTFEFYEVAGEKDGLPIPSETPWAGTGKYGINLADEGLPLSDPAYIFTANDGLFEFKGSENQAEWSDFSPIPEEL